MENAIQYPEYVDEYLSMIWAIGYDYDGFETSVEGLKSVIDDIVELSSQARIALSNGKLYRGDKK